MGAGRKRLIIQELQEAASKLPKSAAKRVQAYADAINRVRAMKDITPDAVAASTISAPIKLKIHAMLDGVEESNERSAVMRVLKKVPGLDALKFRERHKIETLAQLKALLKKSADIDPEQWRYLGFGKMPTVAEARAHASYIQSYLRDLSKDAEMHIVGSFRRRVKQPSDIDVLITGNNSSILDDLINVLNMRGMHAASPYVVRAFRGRKHMVTAICRLPGKKAAHIIDFAYVARDHLPFALMYHTGPVGFNAAMRAIAAARKFKLTDSGLYDQRTKKRVDFTFPNEQSIFKFLGVKYLEPHDRATENIVVAR